jgi:hypothetical protein
MSVDIVFDGPPSACPVFIEVEDDQRRSIKLGEWVQRDDGYWVLRIPDPHELEASRDWWRGEYDAKALGLEHFQARNDELVALLRLCRTALCNMLEDGDLTDRKQAFGTMERIDRALEGALREAREIVVNYNKSGWHHMEIKRIDALLGASHE